MTTRFEILDSPPDRFVFRLVGDDGSMLLQGLPCDGKIAAQNEVLHARNSIKTPERWVLHEDQGRYFAVLKDRDGSVLGRTAPVASEAARDSLIELIRQAASAPLVTRSGGRRRSAG